MINSLKQNIIGFLSPSVKKRKLIAIHSDDWGAERIPSNRIREKLSKSSFIDVDNAYCYYDTLESSEDLLALYEVLSAFKDFKGNNPIITANCLVSNPDFTKIRENNFEKYHYKTVEDTFNQYNKRDAYLLWFEGIEKKLFSPQFHGREHVNVVQWMNYLRNNHKGVCLAFENDVFGVDFRNLSTRKNNFQAAWDFYTKEEENFVLESIKDGFNLFTNIFNKTSSTAIAPSYTWSNKQEEILKSLGVIEMQGLLVQKVPSLKDKSYIYKNRIFNQKYYQTRNVFFEPSIIKNTNTVETSLKRIETLFKYSNPVIISSHRLNFIGGLNEKNRIDNLTSFKKLLAQIMKIWPDVEFVSSEELVKIKHGEEA
jgi:hypothetical protein